MRLSLLLTLLLASAALAGCLGEEDEPADIDWRTTWDARNFTAPEPARVSLDVEWTDAAGDDHDGTIHLDLCPRLAPRHVDSMLEHIRHGSYVGSTFHRVINEFMIQGADITTGDGSGGHAGAYYGIGLRDDPTTWTIPAEFEPRLTHGPGVLSMARTTSPHSGGSQFFIVDRGGDATHLDGQYTIFGRTADDASLDVVDAITQTPTDARDVPRDTVRITDARAAPLTDAGAIEAACQGRAAIDPAPSRVTFDIAWTDADNMSRQGQLALDLCPRLAPRHVDNFLLLAGGGTYDNTSFHRIINGFMIQGGDHQNGDGTGGHAARWYGLGDELNASTWLLPDEAHSQLRHFDGVLSMAKTSEPNTGGSQFFVVDRGSVPSHLDGVHTIFGIVADVADLDLVDQLSQVATGAGDVPEHDVLITGAAVEPIAGAVADRACQFVW